MLIGNIFFNDINEEITSGNLIIDLSEHLVQFLITPNVLENKPNKLIHKRCFKKFNEELFANDLQKSKWKAILKTDLNDVNFSFNQLILKINELLDIHAPFKFFKPKIKKTKHNKPWIASGITISIKKKNKLYKKFCRAKDPEKKSELHKQYKVYKNHKTNLFRKSKDSHF